MDVANFSDREDVNIEKFPFKGTQRDVIGTSIRWLSQCGDDGAGYPEYGLRYFTIQPGGEIPIHNHFYHQTMYILTGKCECYGGFVDDIAGQLDDLKQQIIDGDIVVPDTP